MSMMVLSNQDASSTEGIILFNRKTKVYACMVCKKKNLICAFCYICVLFVSQSSFNYGM